MRNLSTRQKSLLLAVPLCTLIALPLFFNFFNNSSDSARLQYLQMVRKACQNANYSQGKDYNELPKPTRPDLAALQNYIAVVDPQLNRVPSERMIKAVEMSRTMRKTDENQIQWEVFNSNMGGRTRAMLFLPEQPDVVLAGSVSGGLYKNTNALNAKHPWEFVEGFMSNLSVSCLVADPIKSNRIYAGTGEAQTARVMYRESCAIGAGIFVSNDNGETWEQLPSTADFKFITDIAVYNDNGNRVIYAGVASGVYHGTHQSEPSSGLFRSVDDGQTWEQVLPMVPETDPPRYFAPSDIELTSDGKLYVGTMVDAELWGGGYVFSSTTGLADSWKIESELMGYLSPYLLPSRVVLSSCKNHPETVYAQLSGGVFNQSWGFYFFMGKNIVRTTDAGESWQNLTVPNSMWAGLAWHAFALQVDPNDPNRVYSGGLNWWLSKDGGSSWEEVSTFLHEEGIPNNTYVHADQHMLAVSPKNPDAALIASDGGIFLGLDIWGKNNTPRFYEKNKSYNTLQYYSCAIHEEGDETAYLGGMQDNGTSKSEGTSFGIDQMITNGDGAYCFYTDKAEYDCITASQLNWYYYSKDGEVVKSLSNQCGTFISSADYAYDAEVLFANAVSVTFENPGSLFVVEGLPESDNDAQIIQLVDDMGDAWFSAVKVIPSSTETDMKLLLGSCDGRIWKVDYDKTNSSVEEITPQNFPIGNISCIETDASGDKILLTFSNYGLSSIWLSLDGGANWNEVEGNLPDIPVRWALFHPHNGHQALIATEIGVWECEDILSAEVEWIPQFANTGNVRVDMLRVAPSTNTVLAATHGRGLAKAHFHNNYPQSVNECSTDILTMGPNPCRDQLSIQLNSENDYNRYELINVLGQVVKAEDLPAQKEHLLKLTDVTRGNYILRLSGDKKQLSKKLIIEN